MQRSNGRHQLEVHSRRYLLLCVLSLAFDLKNSHGEPVIHVVCWRMLPPWTGTPYNPVSLEKQYQARVFVVSAKNTNADKWDAKTKLTAVNSHE